MVRGCEVLHYFQSKPINIKYMKKLLENFKILAYLTFMSEGAEKWMLRGCILVLAYLAFMILYILNK